MLLCFVFFLFFLTKERKRDITSIGDELLNLFCLNLQW